MLHILKKIGYTLLTIWGVVTVIFLLFTVLGGDPAQMMLGQNESEEQLAAINKKYGFDQSIVTQYRYYLNDLSPLSFHDTDPNHFTYLQPRKYKALQLFELGNTAVVLKWPYLRESFQKNGKKVRTFIAETLPNTAVLAVSAICIALFLGIALGVISALTKDRWPG